MKNLIKATMVSLILFTATSNAEEIKTENTVRNVLNNSYKIYNYGKQKSTGSGFVSANLNGYIITNAHVVDGGEVYQVSGVDKVKKYATLEYVSMKYDLAILKLEHEELKTNGIPHCENTKLQISQELYNFGNPAGLEFIYTKGYISGVPRQILESSQKNKFLVHNLIGYSGQSGSALLLPEHCIAGVVTAGYMSAEIGFSIPTLYVEDMISDFLQKKNNALDIKSVDGNSKTTVIMSDKTFYDQQANILYLKRTEINYKLVLTLLFIILILNIWNRRNKK